MTNERWVEILGQYYQAILTQDWSFKLGLNFEEFKAYLEYARALDTKCDAYRALLVTHEMAAHSFPEIIK